MEAVEFADASPEPPLDTLYDNLYVLGENVPGWYAIDERAPQPFPGEREGERLSGEAKKLAESGADYGGRAASTAGREEAEQTADRDGGEALEEPADDEQEGADQAEHSEGEPEEDEG
jgi:hypothetical protein